MDTKNLDTLIKDIQYLEDFDTRMQKLLVNVEQLLLSVTDESFETKTSPFGNKWKDRALSTKLQLLKDKKLSQSDILQLSGHLRRSVHTRINKDSITLGTNVEKGYAAIHQFGGYAGRNNKVFIPQRAYLPINIQGQLPKELERKIENMVLKYLGV